MEASKEFGPFHTFLCCTMHPSGTHIGLSPVARCAETDSCGKLRDPIRILGLLTWPPWHRGFAGILACWPPTSCKLSLPYRR